MSSSNKVRAAAVCGCFCTFVYQWFACFVEAYALGCKQSARQALDFCSHTHTLAGWSYFLPGELGDHFYIVYEGQATEVTFDGALEGPWLWANWRGAWKSMAE